MCSSSRHLCALPSFWDANKIARCCRGLRKRPLVVGCDNKVAVEPASSPAEERRHPYYHVSSCFTFPLPKNSQANYRIDARCFALTLVRCFFRVVV